MEYGEYRKFDAVGLAELVARGEVTPGELLETAIARAEQVDGRVNAIVRPMHEQARARAATPLSGPLAGVPFLVKDLNQDYAGVPTGCGSRALRDVPAPHHSEVVRRWLNAGLVIFGRTNTPEFGTTAVTEPEVNGPTRNPWNLDHTPGGSSGGSAAAVAAGIVPVAGASDGGGSIRIPAACCGLVGLKPGRGLVPAGPDYAEYLHGAATDGVISRTVRDTAVMLDVLTAEVDPGGPYAVRRPETSYLELSRRPPKPLRIGYTTESPIGTPVDPQAVAAVETAVTMLTELGHRVEPAAPAVDGRKLAEDFLTMWCAQVAATIDEIRRRTGAPARHFELDNRLLAAAARSVKAADYLLAHHRWNEHTRALAAFHEEYDLLLTPTLAGPPVRIGALATPPLLRLLGRALLLLGLTGTLSKTKQWKDTITANLAPVPFTQLANITGRPAISLPLYRTPDGLPLGVQFVAGLGGEGLLLSLATQLEEAHPWADAEPPL
ncbi:MULTISPECIES: amidase [Thermomonospora]|uniref:Amidase n=1 Tax=Thermomonospora curvata (strain ATCC 19995 / DSM 43183 / JCM 3096 / KCTC 9072 / NBRC 15933 / NCIMB 10081 / Henssen B9) TaxID=471852 RepID=D1AC89_THECD|nr:MULTISPECIES: amidase family protein [Thermomonospora]ACY97355.1 Amidase [Thermomonospora curvata DSM 43183]PKK14858.1 MAG: amidase [Thermomonospora sp. CIF 1]